MLPHRATMRRFGFAAASLCLVLSPLVRVCAQVPDALPLQNAAQLKYGARVSVQTRDKNGRDPNTAPDAVLDGNAHTRCVLRGALAVPYTWTITLPFAVPIDKIAFADSDSAGEQAPKDIEIVLDDAAKTTLRQTLAQTPSTRKAIAWQTVPVGKTAQTIKITVLSNHSPSEKVNWGGFGEIAVWTPENIAARFATPGASAANANQTTFVHIPQASGAVSAPDGSVRLPNPVPVGEHPRLVVSKSEIAQLKTDLQTSPKGRATYTAFLRLANGAAQIAPNFPDPKGPMGQLNDRGDAVAKAHSALSDSAGTLGLAYALTGDEKYANRAAEILRGYAARYAAYPEHKGANKNDTGKVMAQRLSEAMWLIPLIESYDFIYNSSVLTPADHTAIENDLIRAAVTFVRLKSPTDEVAARDKANPNWRTTKPEKKGGAANWLLFYNTATMMAGAVMNDANMKDVAFADFKRLLQNGIGPDGMWDEGAIGYQFFAMSVLTAGAETAAHQGMDLWGWDNRRMKMLFDSPLRYAYPDGSAPGINDSGRTRFGDWSTMCYDYAFLRYNDPAYGFLINQSPRQLHTSTDVYFPTRIFTALPEPKAATVGSTVFDGLGYAVLRGPNVYALMDYGPHGGVHGHFDKLNLILFAAGNAPGDKGDEMGGEPKFHRYEDALHDEWTKVSVAHNTLTADEQTQVASEGKLLLFEDTPDLKVMQAQTATALPGALLNRTVVVLPGAVVDIYTGRSAFTRTWDKTLRFNGTLASLAATPGDAPALGKENGYQHLKVASRVSVAQAAWTGMWQTKEGMWNAIVAAAPSQEVVLVRGPDDDNVAVTRQSATNEAAFVTAYQLQSWQNPVTDLKTLPTGDPNLTVAQMTQKDGTVTTVFVASGAEGQMWQANGWSSDARVVCVQRIGNKQPLFVGGGTFAKSANGGEARTAKAGNFHAVQNGSVGWRMVDSWTPAP